MTVTYVMVMEDMPPRPSRFLAITPKTFASFANILNKTNKHLTTSSHNNLNTSAEFFEDVKTSAEVFRFLFLFEDFNVFFVGFHGFSQMMEHVFAVFVRKRNGLGGMSSITVTYVMVMEDMPPRPLRFHAKTSKTVP